MTVLVGQQSAGTTADFFGTGDTAAFPFVAAASGRAALMWMQFKVANPSIANVKLGVYQNNAGVPSTLLASSAVISPSPTGTGLFSGDISAAALDIVSGTTYWLAVCGNGEDGDLQGTSSTGVGRESNPGLMPSPWNASPGGNMNVLPVIWVEDAVIAGAVLPVFMPLTLAPWAKGPFLVRPPAAPPVVPGQNVAVGTVVEDDLAQAIDRTKTRTVGVASETDLAQSVSRAKSRVIGIALETDLAQAISRTKQRAIGIASETDLAQAVNRAKSRAIGFVTETDLAQVVTRTKQKAVGIAVETDLAQAIQRQKSRAIGVASETDLAQAVSRAKSRIIGIATETDLALPVVRSGATAVKRYLKRMMGMGL